jgi:hypothetical protein
MRTHLHKKTLLRLFSRLESFFIFGCCQVNKYSYCNNSWSKSLLPTASGKGIHHINLFYVYVFADPWKVRISPKAKRVVLKRTMNEGFNKRAEAGNFGYLFNRK